MSYESESVMYLWAFKEENRNYAKRTIATQLALNLVPHFEYIRSCLVPQAEQEKFDVPESAWKVALGHVNRLLEVAERDIPDESTKIKW